MPTGTIEHANLTVTRPERSAELFKQLLGWEERWRGHSQLGGDTIHVGAPGNGSDYIALYTNDDARADTGRHYAKGEPLNHLHPKGQRGQSQSQKSESFHHTSIASAGRTASAIWWHSLHRQRAQGNVRLRSHKHIEMTFIRPASRL